MITHTPYFTKQLKLKTMKPLFQNLKTIYYITILFIVLIGKAY